MVRRLLPVPPGAASPRVLIHNDAVIALAGGAGRLYGVVIIAGTGAIAYGVNAKGERRRASGWGHLLGDEGSGYHTGLGALRAVLRAHDGRGPATLLRDLVLDHWRLGKPEDLVGLVYAPDFPRRRIGELLALVDEAAGRGDAVALDLLAEAGRELGLAAAAVIRGLGMEGQRFEVVLAGGAFKTRQVLRAAVSEAVLAAAPGATLIDPRHEPAMGAALLALEAVVVGVSSLRRALSARTVLPQRPPIARTAQFPFGKVTANERKRRRWLRSLASPNVWDCAGC